MDWLTSNGPLVAALLGGFAIGWLLEFLIDFVFWRRRYQNVRTEYSELQTALNRHRSDKSAMQLEANAASERASVAEDEIDKLVTELKETEEHNTYYTTQLTEAEARLRQLTEVEQANEALRVELTEAKSEIAELRSHRDELSHELGAMETHADSSLNVREALLESQRQAEQVSAENKRLRDQLASAESELAAINARQETAALDAESAHSLQMELSDKRTEADGLRTKLAAATARTERMGFVEKENTDLLSRVELLENDLLNEQNKLVAAEVKLQNMADKLTDERMRADQLSRTAATTENTTRATDLQARLDAANSEIADLRARLNQPAATMASMSTTSISAAPSRVDKLQAIKGIGNVFARRLNEANIYSYAQLAAQTPDSLTEIVKAQPWQAIEPEAWIAEARSLTGNMEA